LFPVDFLSSFCLVLHIMMSILSTVVLVANAEHAAFPRCIWGVDFVYNAVKVFLVVNEPQNFPSTPDTMFTQIWT
jgi:hypothetical protein